MTRDKILPTIRQRRLGSELRVLRERAGLTATRAGQLFGVTQSRISNIEIGRYAVSAERVRALANLYDCGDEPLIDALAAMTGGRTRGWWEEYREILPTGALDLAELEHHATFIRVATVIHMPGLLQTADHARSVIADAVPPLPPHAVEQRVSHRIKRQGILYGDKPTPLTAVIHEAALRMAFGGSRVATTQLKHLLSWSERDHVTVRVIPFGAGTFPNAGQGIDHFGAELPQLDSIQLDSDHGSLFFDAYSQLDKYRTVLDRMETCALSPDESRDFIHRVEKTL
ncbi:MULTISPECIES: helix-turn-helix domain-containing protein [Streptomyces]|uniref:helix-turn-helix domain-containing protein n=1 Tax=Streptomyces TaxID=1883 RepID=UPI000694B268|nr:helix-turn-helix transcriptional regulator [Streptomyces sp. NRRL F-2890]